MKAAPKLVAVALAVAWLILAPLGSGAQEQPDVTEELVEANALIQQRQYDKAMESFEGILARLPIDSPDMPETLSGLRRACDAAWAGDRFVKTVGLLFERLQDARLEGEPYRSTRLVLVRALAEYHYSHRNTLEAIKFYKQVLELSPPGDKDNVENILAQLYEEGGYVAEALELLAGKLEAKPDNQFLRRRKSHLV